MSDVKSVWGILEHDGALCGWRDTEAEALEVVKYRLGRTVAEFTSENGLEAFKLRGRFGMKTFFVWLFVQCIFARLMVGMCLGLWSSMKISPDFLGWFMAPAVLVCLAEAITSSIVVYPLINPSNRR